MPVSTAFLNDSLIIETCRGKRTLSCSRWQSRRRRVKINSQLSRYALLQWDDWLVQVWHLSWSPCLSFHKTEHAHHSLWQQQHPHADVDQQKSANWCLHYTRSRTWEVLDHCCSPRLQPRSRQFTYVLLENGIKKRILIHTSSLMCQNSPLRWDVCKTASKALQSCAHVAAKTVEAESR